MTRIFPKMIFSQKVLVIENSNNEEEQKMTNITIANPKEIKINTTWIKMIITKARKVAGKENLGLLKIKRKVAARQK